MPAMKHQFYCQRLMQGQICLVQQTEVLLNGSKVLGFKIPFKVFAESFKIRNRNVLNIGIFRMMKNIFLVIFFGRVEFRKWFYLCCNFSAITLFIRQSLYFSV